MLKAASIGLAVIIGLVCLWVPNPSWGASWGDILVAILTGFGITLTGGVSLRGLAGNYASPALSSGHRSTADLFAVLWISLAQNEPFLLSDEIAVGFDVGCAVCR